MSCLGGHFRGQRSSRAERQGDDAMMPESGGGCTRRGTGKDEPGKGEKDRKIGGKKKARKREQTKKEKIETTLASEAVPDMRPLRRLQKIVWPVKPAFAARLVPPRAACLVLHGDDKAGRDGKWSFWGGDSWLGSQRAFLAAAVGPVVFVVLVPTVAPGS